MQRVHCLKFTNPRGQTVLLTVVKLGTAAYKTVVAPHRPRPPCHFTGLLYPESQLIDPYSTMCSRLTAVKRLGQTVQHLHLSDTESKVTANFLDNQLIPSKTCTWYEVLDPATNQVVNRVPQTTPDELISAVRSAERAFSAWRAVSLLSRQQVLFRYVQLIRDNYERLAAVITLEQGKTIADARGDVLRGLQVAEAACNSTPHLMGEVLEVAKDMETRSYRLPLGVVAAICPFSKLFVIHYADQSLWNRICL